jgi:hypothetical protein
MTAPFYASLMPRYLLLPAVHRAPSVVGFTISRNLETSSHIFFCQFRSIFGVGGRGKPTPMSYLARAVSSFDKEGVMENRRPLMLMVSSSTAAGCVGRPGRR